jgi:predicted RNA-binding Zn ribbon-like protein
MQFEFIGGQLALDFVNTASNRSLPGESLELREHLNAYGDLVAWATEAHALPSCAPGDLIKAAAQHPKVASRTLEEARAFRESLYRIFTAFGAGKEAPAADMDRLNQLFRRANAHRTLTCNDGNTHGAPTFDWAWDASNAELDRVLWPVALAAAELLTSGDPQRLKECGGDHCNWLFLDQSKNRSRRWCTMEDCGSKVKAKRHYHRQRIEA